MTWARGYGIVTTVAGAQSSPTLQAEVIDMSKRPALLRKSDAGATDYRNAFLLWLYVTGQLEY
jgi:hypothetical protein